MIKINKHIQIVRSNIKGQSSMSQKSCDALYAVLFRHYKKVGVSAVDTIEDLDVVVSLRPDLVFLGVKSIPVKSGIGNDKSTKIWLSHYFDENNIPCTGSGSLAHKLENDKSLAKQRAGELGLSTSNYFVATQNKVILESDNLLKYPLFVKPVDRGGGLGIDKFSVVHSLEQLRNRVKKISKLYNTDSLVEEYLDGREFSVAILKKEAGPEFYLMPLELIAPKDKFGFRILSNEVKCSDTESFMKVSDKTLSNKLVSLAEDVFMALGARDYGRIDIRLDTDGLPHFLEANLNPSLIEGYGSFPKACLLNESFDYESIILKIVDLALSRCEVPGISLEDNNLILAIA